METQNQLHIEEKDAPPPIPQFSDKLIDKQEKSYVSMTQVLEAAKQRNQYLFIWQGHKHVYKPRIRKLIENRFVCWSPESCEYEKNQYRLVFCQHIKGEYAAIMNPVTFDIIAEWNDMFGEDELFVCLSDFVGYDTPSSNQ